VSMGAAEHLYAAIHDEPVSLLWWELRKTC
jgi:hypothetical protein